MVPPWVLDKNHSQASDKWFAARKARKNHLPPPGGAGGGGGRAMVLLCFPAQNGKTKFLLNKYSLKYKKILIVGAISKMDGHIFTFDFKNKTDPCLKCFYQTEPSDEILNCEYEGILGPVAGIVGNIQAIEVLKKILKIGDKSSKKILILDLNKLNFRKVEFNKKKNCICKKS